MSEEAAAKTPTISTHEVEQRKAWLELGKADEEVITSEIDHLVDGNADELMDQMYKHFLSFEDTRSFFPDETILERAKSAQKAYFVRLTKGNYDEKYVSDRLHIGSTHHRIDLDPKWYLGAYNRALSFIIPLIVAKLSNNTKRLSQVLLSFLKLIFFDMGLAIEAYIAAKERSIRKHRDAINELQTEQRVIKGILENSPIGIVTMDKDFTCLECNEEFKRILGKETLKEITGKSLFELAPNLKKQLFSNVLETGQPLRKSAEHLRFALGAVVEETYWDCTSWPVKDQSGNTTGLVAMFANATDRVLLQQQREDFVATLTHDLKTPVLATNRAVKFFLEGDFGSISDEQKEVLETILHSNTSLYSLVQTLLEVYRFDSGVKQLMRTHCNIAGIITQMVTEIMPLAQHKGVELKAVLPADAVDIKCDEEEIRRVLQNLIDNSLKFTPAGGSITVSMEQSEHNTKVTVTDTGRGIPEENKPKLFQRFWQAGSTGRYYASTGLGLYLCRRIMEAHDGRIWCESKEGEGSSFHIEF